MAKRPAKKTPKQLELPSARSSPPTITILAMQLHVGDHITDSTGEWEVVGRPFATAGGKNAHARLQRVNQPGVTDIRTWGAHERISVKRVGKESKG